MYRKLHDNARSIFHQALAASSIPAAFDRLAWQSLSLDRYDRIYAVAVGKAALPMLDSLQAHLTRALAGGVCCAPLLPEQRISGIDYFTGGHPLPNQDSFASACRAVSLLRETVPGLRLLSHQRRRFRHVRAAWTRTSHSKKPGCLPGPGRFRGNDCRNQRGA